jgi:hypothetical protein
MAPWPRILHAFARARNRDNGKDCMTRALRWLWSVAKANPDPTDSRRTKERDGPQLQQRRLFARAFGGKAG